MYGLIFGQTAYSFFNTLAMDITLVASLFLFPLKREALGLHSKRIVYFISRKNSKVGTVVKYILISLESYLMAYLLTYATRYNMSFGEIVGTGANYFATLILVVPLWSVSSLALMINPLKQIDIITLLAPLFLFFVKIACFCNGCCWGIPWEYGPYNHHSNHPGNQVPVQALEALCALAIFVFLLIYRKKAKTGTLYPIYIILYSVTRFPIEFFSAAHEKVFGPFNTYHILCVAGIAVGVALLLIIKIFGDKISNFFNAKEENFFKNIARKEEEKVLKIAEEEAKELERLEKVRLAREKAKARRRK